MSGMAAAIPKRLIPIPRGCVLEWRPPPARKIERSARKGRAFPHIGAAQPQIQIFCVTSVIKINFAPLLFRPRFFYLLDSVTFTRSKQISNIIHVLSLFAWSGSFLSDRSDTLKNSNSTDPKNLPFSEIFITLNEAANSSPPLA